MGRCSGEVGRWVSLLVHLRLPIGGSPQLCDPNLLLPTFISFISLSPWRLRYHGNSYSVVEKQLCWIFLRVVDPNGKNTKISRCETLVCARTRALRSPNVKGSERNNSMELAVICETRMQATTTQRPEHSDPSYTNKQMYK